MISNKKLGLIIITCILSSPLITMASPFSEYQKYSQKNPVFKKFEKTPEFTLGQIITPKELNKNGYYLDKSKKTESKFEFYKNINNQKEIFKIPVNTKGYLIKDQKIISLFIGIDGEKNYNELKKALTEKFGKPEADMQENTELTSLWGEESEQKDKSIFPLVLTFNIYSQKGAIVWSDPILFFGKK